VSLNDKVYAREILLSYGRSIIEKSEGKIILVRVNDVKSEFAQEDIAAAISLKVTGIILPKATAQHVHMAEAIILSKIDNEENFAIIPLIETALGLETIWETLNASPLVRGAQFGAEDFTRDLQIMRTSSGKEVEYARNRFALACRAKGIATIDTPFANFKDNEGLAEDIVRVKNMGMTGKTCIHPSQIDKVNAIFMPSEEEIEKSKKIVQCWESQGNFNNGVIVVEGEMIDIPIYQRAKNILRKIDRNKL
jgi:citrate lyase subunit beta/citryl-CoA lyase